MAEVIAHEIAHFNSVHALGFRSHLRQPVWKSEGWAEYQANLAPIRADPDWMQGSAALSSTSGMVCQVPALLFRQVEGQTSRATSRWVIPKARTSTDGEAGCWQKR
jgi:hypothetical protein